MLYGKRDRQSLLVFSITRQAKMSRAMGKSLIIGLRPMGSVLASIYVGFVLITPNPDRLVADRF